MWTKPNLQIEDVWIFVSRENNSVFIVNDEDADSMFSEEQGFSNMDKQKLLKMQTGDFLDCVQWVVIRK